MDQSHYHPYSPQLVAEMFSSASYNTSPRDQYLTTAPATNLYQVLSPANNMSSFNTIANPPLPMTYNHSGVTNQWPDLTSLGKEEISQLRKSLFLNAVTAELSLGGAIVALEDAFASLKGCGSSDESNNVQDVLHMHEKTRKVGNILFPAQGAYLDAIRAVRKFTSDVIFKSAIIADDPKEVEVQLEYLVVTERTDNEEQKVKDRVRCPVSAYL